MRRDVEITDQHVGFAVIRARAVMAFQAVHKIEFMGKFVVGDRVWCIAACRQVDIV